MIHTTATTLSILIAATGLMIAQIGVDLHFSWQPTNPDFIAKIWKYASASTTGSMLADSTSIGIDDGNPSASSTKAEIELTLSKEYPSSLWPVEQQYVKYDLHLRNLGTSDLQNQVLWSRFTSESGKTLHDSTFMIPELHAGDTTVLHLGPFKMHDGSSHMLFVGMNRLGDSGIPNDVNILNISPTSPIDSFGVISKGTLQNLIIGSILLVAGFGIMVIYLVFTALRKKQEQVGMEECKGNHKRTSKNNDNCN
jgi:hypothetical protein